jgi:hypothetical protein
MGCGGIQTESSCKMNRTGQINFYNPTGVPKRGIYCKIVEGIPVAPESCSDIFDIPKGFSFLALPTGSYEIYVKTVTRIEGYKVDLDICEDVDFRIKRTRVK